MLQVDSLTVAYGGLHALTDVSLRVGEGQFVAIVGPNGAGKTTLFKAISGTVTPVSGRISYQGQDLLAVPPAQRPHLGIAHVPEGRQVFASMTVLENLEMGAYLPAGRAAWRRSLERIFALFPVLADRRAAARRHALGRRAADGGDRPRARLQRPSCCCWTSRRWDWRRAWRT